MNDDLLTNLLKNFLFFPTMNLQRAFSPTVNFGCNIEDVGVEEHVLGEVGSYGKQLNSILDLLMVILPRIIDNKARPTLTPGERRIIDRFEDLARRADQVAAAYEGKTRQGITRAHVDCMIDGLHNLKTSNNAAYLELLRHIHEALPLPQGESDKRSRT
jgi:hypothetical protein